MQSIVDRIQEFFDGDIFSEFFAWLLGVGFRSASSFFSSLCDKFLSFFSGSHGVIVDTGRSIINNVFSSSVSDYAVLSSDFLYFFVGLIFTVFALKILLKMIIDVIFNLIELLPFE